ncbi:hypothetical protein DFH09DRAFT_1166014 [Mycena vulgaris]|nr:hypothetical protein DFH09DRAFT_1166014 [Mycena vulgaris]
MSLPTFTSETTGEEVVNVFADQIQGKNVLITGTSLNGIGFESARVIAKHANLVIITGYNLERWLSSAVAFNDRSTHIQSRSMYACHSNPLRLVQHSTKLQVLIHNAAAAQGPFKLTVDSFESQMATAHIAPFLLMKLIAPKILASGTVSFTPRVVFVSSSGHAFGPGIDLNTVGHPDPKKYNPFDAYCQAKCANILTAIELSKRSQRKIHAYSLHPGVIFTNMNQKEESKAHFQAAGILGPDGLPSTEKYTWKTIPQGAATTVDCVEANVQIAPHSSDPVIAEKLWTLTEEIIGESFTF